MKQTVQKVSIFLDFIHKKKSVKKVNLNIIITIPCTVEIMHMASVEFASVCCKIC